MDEFIHWQKLNLLLSTTCDETLSWMIEFWMEHHLVSDSKLQHYQSTISLKYVQEITNNVKMTFSVGDTIWRFTINMEQDN